MRRTKKILFFTLVIFLSCGIGYALLSDTITIGGTATTTGTFDVNIINAVVETEVGNTNSTIVISSDKKSITVDVPALQYPGAYTTFALTIKNEGNINAKLIDIVEKSMGDSNILVSYNDINENSILTPNQTLTFYVKVEWKSTSVSASVSGANIDIDFIYQQSI